MILTKTGQQHGKSTGSRSTVLDKTNYSFINLTGMKFFFLHLSEKKKNDQQEDHPVVAVEESLHNITDGGEFLDDALRMIDQPLMYAEKSDAPGSPESL
jgi:hypothetical protein